MATLASSPRSTLITLASASSGPFDVDFRLFDSTTLAVYVDGVRVTTGWTLSATYSAGFTDDATITFDDDLPAGTVLLIDGDQQLARQVDYLAADPSIVSRLNIELPRLWAGLQEVKREASRGLRLLEGIAPMQTPEESETIVWDGEAFVPGPSLQRIDDAEGFAQRAEDALNSIIYTQFFERSVIGDGTIDAIMFPGEFTVKDHFVDVNVGGVPQGKDRFSLILSGGNTFLTFAGPIPLGLKASAKVAEQVVSQVGEEDQITDLSVKTVASRAAALAWIAAHAVPKVGMKLSWPSGVTLMGRAGTETAVYLGVGLGDIIDMPGWGTEAADDLGPKTYPSLAEFVATTDAPPNGTLRNVVLPNNRVAQYLRNTSAINGGLVSKPGFEPSLTVDVTMFGAVGDSDKAKKAANTAAIQEAFLYAENHPIGRRRTVIFPEGYFWVGDQLRLSQGGVSLRALNKNSRLRREDDYGDTIYWAAVDPTVTRLTDIEIADLYFDNQGEMTTGAHLHLSDMIRVETRGLNIWNGFGGIRARGLQKWNDLHSTISAGEAWDPDPFLPGSYFVTIDRPQNPANKSTEIGITQPNWCRTGAVTDVPRVEHGLLFAEGDGVWIAGGHIFGADACIRHKPSDAARICTGLKATGTWLDQWSSRHYSAEGNTTGGFGGVDLIGVRGLNAIEKSIHIGTECVDFSGLEIKGGRYSIANGGTDHIDIGAGSRFTIDTNVVSRQAMSAGARGIRIRDAARNVVIADGTAIACDAATGPLAIGIQVDTANPTVTVGKVAFHGVTQEFSLPNPIPQTSSYAISKSTRTPIDIESVTVSGGTISLPFLASSFDITGTAGDLVDIIGGQEGRVVELRAIGAQFVIRHNTGASGSRIRTPWSGPLVLRAGASVTLRYSARASAWLAQPQDVVRSGSNSNGSFVEYADGRTECRHTLTSSATEDVVWTFPQAIISEVGATVMVTPRTSSSTPKITASRVPTTTTVAIAVYNRDDTRAAVAVSLEMKGRWHNET